MDLSDLRDSYTPTCQSFRSSHTNIRKGLSTDSLLDRIPPVHKFDILVDCNFISFLFVLQADTAGPRVSSGVRKSLDNLTRSSSVNTSEEQRWAKLRTLSNVNFDPGLTPGPAAAGGRGPVTQPAGRPAQTEKHDPDIYKMREKEEYLF